jgi:hypothetical protein
MVKLAEYHCEKGPFQKNTYLSVIIYYLYWRHVLLLSDFLPASDKGLCLPRLYIATPIRRMQKAKALSRLV